MSLRTTPRAHPNVVVSHVCTNSLAPAGLWHNPHCEPPRIDAGWIQGIGRRSTTPSNRVTYSNESFPLR